jgi:pimeloyl-ACP methyl ester carboxylesterase
MLAPVLATGRRVLALDQRGQYESPGSEDPSAYSVRALADDLLMVVNYLGAPVHLVGHSFGGLVSRDLLIRRPDVARTFTLLDSGPAALGGNRRIYLEFMTPILRDGGLPAVYDALEQVQAQDPRTQSLPEDVKAFLRRRFLSQSPVAVETTGQALLGEPDRVDELKAAYRGPMLVACGAGDDAWPPDEQAAMADRLGAPFETIPDAMHSPAAENPLATTKMLAAFWDASA